MVLTRVEGRPVVADTARPEVEAADELADDQEVDLTETRRAEIRVNVELGAQPEHPLLGPDVGCVELGIADGRLEDGVGAATGRERLLGKRRPRRPDRGGTEEVIIELEVGREVAQHALRHDHHLGPDAVAGQAHDARAWLRSGHEECRHYKLGSGR